MGAINGVTIGGVNVTVSGGNNTTGTWEVKGAIQSIYVGGQEFAIDDVCVRKNEAIHAENVYLPCTLVLHKSNSRIAQ